MFDLMSCVVPNLSSLPVMLPMEVDITPNDDGLPGIAQLRNIVGAVMTIGLILSVPITTGIAAMTVGPAKVLATGPKHGDDEDGDAAAEGAAPVEPA